MQAGKNVKHISPVSEADRYEELDWDRYLPGCDNKPYGVSYEINHYVLEEVKKLPESEWGKFGSKLFYTKNFKLYEVNLGQILDNRKGILFYAEKRESDKPSTPGNGGYKLISPVSCEVIGGMFTHDPYDYYRKTPLDNYNGVIRYKGKIYTYDLRQSIANSTQYVLSGYGFGKNGKFGSMCSIGKNLKKGDKK